MTLFFDPDRAGPGAGRTTRTFFLGWDPLHTDRVDPAAPRSDADSRGPLFRARGGTVSDLKLHRDDDVTEAPPAPIPFPSPSARDAHPSLSPEHEALVAKIDDVFEQMGEALDALAEDLDAIPFPRFDDDDDGPWAA